MERTLDGLNLKNMKHWCCDKNDQHVLGVLERVQVNVKVDGANFTYYSPRLMIFRETVDLAAEIPSEVNVAGTIEGKTLFHMVWKCSMPNCNGVQKWRPEKELLNYFVKTYLAE